MFVDNFGSADPAGSAYDLWVQVAGLGDLLNTTVTGPASAVAGSTDTVTVDYTGLAPTRNIGVLHHLDANGEIERTILDIDAR